MRNAPRPCPVDGCNRSLPWPRAIVCGRCFARIPADLKKQLHDTRAAQAWHRHASAGDAAVAWLNAHPVAVDRRTGEAPG